MILSPEDTACPHPVAPPVLRNALTPSLTLATPHWTHCGTSYNHEGATFLCSSPGPWPAELEKPQKAPLRSLDNWEFEGLWPPLGPPQCQCDRPPGCSKTFTHKAIWQGPHSSRVAKPWKPRPLPFPGAPCRPVEMEK